MKKTNIGILVGLAFLAVLVLTTSVQATIAVDASSRNIFVEDEIVTLQDIVDDAGVTDAIMWNNSGTYWCNYSLYINNSAGLEITDGQATILKLVYDNATYFTNITVFGNLSINNTQVYSWNGTANNSGISGHHPPWRSTINVSLGDSSNFVEIYNATISYLGYDTANVGATSDHRGGIWVKGPGTMRVIDSTFNNCFLALKTNNISTIQVINVNINNSEYPLNTTGSGGLYILTGNLTSPTVTVRNNNVSYVGTGYQLYKVNDTGINYCNTYQTSYGIIIDAESPANQFYVNNSELIKIKVTGLYLRYINNVNSSNCTFKVNPDSIMYTRGICAISGINGTFYNPVFSGAWNSDTAFYSCVNFSVIYTNSTLEPDVGDIIQVNTTTDINITLTKAFVVNPPIRNLTVNVGSVYFRHVAGEADVNLTVINLTVNSSDTIDINVTDWTNHTWDVNGTSGTIYQRVGNLTPGGRYEIAVDGVQNTTVYASTDGYIWFNFSGAWSEHTISVTRSTPSPNPSGGGGGGIIEQNTCYRCNPNTGVIEIETITGECRDGWVEDQTSLPCYDDGTDEETGGGLQITGDGDFEFPDIPIAVALLTILMLGALYLGLRQKKRSLYGLVIGATILVTLIVSFIEGYPLTWLDEAYKVTSFDNLFINFLIWGAILYILIKYTRLKAYLRVG